MKGKEVEMKKKILTVLLMMVTVFSICVMPAYAEEDNPGEIAPDYTGVSSVISYMDIDD